MAEERKERGRRDALRASPPTLLGLPPPKMALSASGEVSEVM